MELEGKLFVREGLMTDSEAQAYIMQGVFTDVDAGSKFDVKNQCLLKQLSPRDLMTALANQGYDVMLGYNGGKIIGHIAYQEHHDEIGANWQIFRIKIQPEYQGRGYSIPIITKFIEKGRVNKALRLKCGDESTANEKMVKMLRILKRKESELRMSVDQNSHWFTLEP